MSGRPSRASKTASRAAATMQSGQAALVFRNRVAQFRPTWSVGDRRSISFREFRQIVRRYRPSRLLPELAALAAATQLVDRGDPMFSTAPPWAIALAARESILWGNAYRRDEVTDSDLLDIFNGHNNIYEGDPAPEDENFVLRLMTRLAYEQFPMQESVFEEVARPHALLVEGVHSVSGLQVLADPDAWNSLLGAPLGQMVGATMFLQVAANQNGGWYDPDWLTEGRFEPVFQAWPREVIELRAEQLSTTFDGFRASYEAALKKGAPPPGYERFAFNPLVTTPFLRMSDGRLLAPQPRLILPSVSPGALYYQGLGVFGKPFADDLGQLTEGYVGRQLRSLSDHVLAHPEVIYGKEHLRSIDWFWVFPSVVVLVEVKSARFGLSERAGAPDFEDAVATRLGKAADQIARTEAALVNGLPDFDHIPNDRPRISIIVTGEPHHLVNSPWMRNLFAPPPVPMLTASLRDLEMLVSLPAERVEEQLVAIAHDADKSSWSLANALDNDARIDPSTGKPYRNQILDEAWSSYPWLRERPS